eukprot:TRINITY_DN18486_c0_g1_i1.p1 TRINITY_DN18486_c0_g1~~TRINITY_DN18486_c0_g1_i1.p1  ORF type:complete len:342 (-),score=39.57 TRINITY_DN18486_c0_g1_i1:88-1113(-)
MLTSPALVAVFLGWFVLWFALHASASALVSVVPRFFCVVSGPARASIKHGVDALPWDKRVYLRRLLRSQVYYIAASAVGLWLLFGRGQYAWAAFISLDRGGGPSAENALRQMLLSQGGDAMVVVFLGAIAHWVCATVEDCASWRYLLQLDSADDRIVLREGSHENLSNAMLQTYVVHHMVTIVAFGYYICTRQLSVLCCMGLLFELPVCFTNLREISVSFDAEARSCGLCEAPQNTTCFSSVRSRWWWFVTAGAVVFGRYSSIFAYVWTLCFWRAELHALPSDVSVFFHIFGGFFSVLNVLWSLQLFFWSESDRYCQRGRRNSSFALSEDASLTASAQRRR